MSKGIVVDHKDTQLRYAISEHNFNPKVHTKVRDLKPGESILSFRPKKREKFEQDEAAAELERAKWRADLASAQDQLDFSSIEESEEVPPYEEWTVDELRAEINTRNSERADEDKIHPESTLKADLIAALEADDDASEGSSTPE